MDEIYWMPATQLRKEMQNRNIGVEEVTKAFLNRIKKYDRRFNAVSEIHETAIKQARALDSATRGRDALLFGLPLLVKDNIDVAGLHTTAGSMALADNLAESNAVVIENIIHHGGIILGKTNMTELANFTSQAIPKG